VARNKGVKSVNFVILTDTEMDVFEKETVEAVKKVLNSQGKVRVLRFNPLFLNDIHEGDVVFNLAVGERHDFAQGFISAALEAAKVEFIGSPAYTHYICLNKFATKALLRAYGVCTPSGAVYDGKEWWGEIPEPPLMVKPSAEGSGIGVDEKSLCLDAESAKKIANEKYDNFKEPILIEKYIEGKEVTVGVIGTGDKVEVLPPLEVDFSNLPHGVETYYSKRVKEEYADQTIYRCPANLNAKTLRLVKKTALQVFKAVRARDFIRIDMRISSDHIPYVIEVNSRPGLHPILSDIPKMVKPLSKDYEWLIKEIIERAITSMEV
jgi:D-alanine-D-alanine ligase